MSAGLELEIRSGDSRSMIIVSGDLDMDSSPRLLEAIRAALKRAADLDVEGVGLFEPPPVGRGQPHHRLAEGDDVHWRPLLDRINWMNRIRSEFVDLSLKSCSSC